MNAANSWPEDWDPEELPGAALRLTTGVTVLTACHDGRRHGSTISSTGLVFRNPLTIGAGLRRNSELSDLAWDSGWFAVNVLSGRQALIADWFADPQRPRNSTQFEMLDWEPDPTTGLPLLSQALAQLICRVVDRVPVGDQVLLLAEAVRGRSGSGSPLISFDGALYSAEFRDVVRRRRGHSLTGAAATSLD